MMINKPTLDGAKINRVKVKQTKVWDIFVRSFHWVLVTAFVVAYATEDDFLKIHVWLGYLVIALLLLRLLWGFVGSKHARFSDFVFSYATVTAYLKDVLLLKAKRYLGHNPAGGAMIVTILVSLLVTTISGVMVYGAAENAGPLASAMSHSDLAHNIMEEIHEFFANFTLLLVFIHVLGVVFESLLHRENLVRAMITGYKPVVNNNVNENVNENVNNKSQDL